MENRAMVARWTDERGENRITGIVRGVAPLRILSTNYGIVTVPDDAEVFQPARPEMIPLGRAGDVKERIRTLTDSIGRGTR